MRRKDREVTDFEEILSILRKCDVCRLALNDGDYPYLLPLNFGLAVEDGRAVLSFHGAMEGKKYDLLEKDPRASFEVDCGHRLLFDEGAGYCTMEYESVVGRGQIVFLSEEEKEAALDVLVRQYHPEGFAYNRAALSRTRIFKLVVEEMTAKRKRKPPVGI